MRIWSKVAPALFRVLAVHSLLLSGGAYAAECEHPVARAISVQGAVERSSPNAQQWVAVRQDDTFCANDRLRVRVNSRAALYLNNDTFLRLGEQSSIVFSGRTDESSSWLEVLRGVAHFMSRVRQSFKATTPYMNAAVEGTEFTVRVDTDAGYTQVTVLEGRVIASNSTGEVALEDGQSARAHAGQAPVIQSVVRPRDTVQWTLYYPPVLYFDGEPAASEAGWEAPFKASVAAYRRGDITQAFAALSGTGTVESTRFYTYRAALKLSVGRVVSAGTDLDRALALQADDTDALALKSIIATTLNEPDAALVLAQQAVSANPQAAGAQLALSYAWQARAELEQARDAGEAAVKAALTNSLAWSRLAELRLMLGDLGGALQAAQQAAELDPENAQSQTTLGFAHLTRLDSAAAQEAFIRAAALDEAAPLPRLGMGLALIHTGQLAAGRHQIEIAANLDPLNALIRSYLGKAYYEEKRDADASKQFSLAKGFDSHDPTAWFYDAILKQTVNRPIEALEDLQTSIALNENRAVYRSRLLLDQDRAVRNANLSRIYADLGFEQLALNESRKSLSIDAGNYSAHRFLSDAYNGVPRHEIARVSERLQSQLLQPVSVVPVSPSASEARLFAFEGTGASTAGFNEFNPLFERRRISLLASGVVGSNDTRSGEIAAGAFFNRGMLSVGRFEERSDGIQDNSDSDQSVDNAYAQFQLVPSLGIQAEYRNRNSEFGDLRMRMSEVVTNERRKIDRDSWRIGLNYSPSPRNTFLVSFARQDLSDTTKQGFFSAETENDGPQYEAQHIYRGRRLQTVTGIGYLDLDGEFTTRISLPGFSSPTPYDQKLEQKMAYLYTYLPWSRGEVVLGLDYADIDKNNGVSTEKLNPKLGLTWDAGKHTTVRMAAFRTLRTELVNSQTIAPTQLVGFNQLFDDFLGSDAWRYGLGLDHQISKDLAAGAEVSWRNVNDKRSKLEPPSISIITDDRDEQSHRAYFYWTPTATLALSSEYYFDSFKRNFIDGDARINRPAKTTTHSVPVGVGYFHASGFFSRFVTTYIRQEVSNVRPSTGTEKLHDNFWISDLTLGYRLPKRHGLIELTVRNLFDQNFKYQSTDPGTDTFLTSPYYPEVATFLNLQLWL